MIMNLKELLAQKTNKTIEQLSRKPTNKQTPSQKILPKEKEQEEEKIDISYTSIEPPPPALYNLYISILTKRTYTSILDTRDFLKFLLSPYSFTINTFEQMQYEDMQEIFQTYMGFYPPRSSYHLHALYITLWEIELKVPRVYKEQIVQNVKNWGLAQISENC